MSFDSCLWMVSIISISVVLDLDENILGVLHVKQASQADSPQEDKDSQTKTFGDYSSPLTLFCLAILVLEKPIFSNNFRHFIGQTI